MLPVPISLRQQQRQPSSITGDGSEVFNHMTSTTNFIQDWAKRAAIIAVAVFSCANSALAQDFQLNEETFNQWLYSASQGTFDPDGEMALTIEAIDRVCKLSDDQKDKLELAARGDFSRFEHQVDELRAEHVGKTYGQNEIGEVYQKIQPLAAQYQAGLLGDTSLFSKVLEGSLTSEQSKKFERIEEERRHARYAAKIGLFVAGLQRSCALTAKQRQELTQLLLDQTRPPKLFGQYDWYVILYQAAKLPDDKYKQIVDEAQLKPLKQTLQQGQGMEQWLRQQNLIE
jgi:hypothetical protein